MRTPTTTLFEAVKLKKPNGKRTWMIQRRSHGKRERIYFENETKAKKEANDRNRKIESHGTSVKLTPEEQIYASACIEDLAKIGRTLRDATDHYLAAFQRPATTVSEFLNRYREEQLRRLNAKEKMSPRHYETILYAMKKVESRYGDNLLSSLDGKKI